VDNCKAKLSEIHPNGRLPKNLDKLGIYYPKKNSFSRGSSFIYTLRIAKGVICSWPKKKLHPLVPPQASCWAKRGILVPGGHQGVKTRPVLKIKVILTDT